MEKSMKNLIILFLFYTPVFITHAQVMGKISNAETHLPLPNANIIVANKNIGTSSGKNGEFILVGDIKEGDILVISYVGFTTKKITISKKDLTHPQLIILLEPAIIPAQTVLVERSEERRVGKE